MLGSSPPPKSLGLLQLPLDRPNRPSYQRPAVRTPVTGLSPCPRFKRSPVTILPTPVPATAFAIVYRWAVAAARFPCAYRTRNRFLSSLHLPPNVAGHTRRHTRRALFALSVYSRGRFVQTTRHDRPTGRGRRF